MSNAYYLSALLTAAICMAVVGIAILRLGLCGGCMRPRLKYTAVILSAFIAAGQPYINAKMPGIGCLALAICILLLLIDGAPPFKWYRDKNQFFDTQIYNPNLHGDDK